ncbi:MAG: phosphoglycolate phosphatase [Gammaproteobacteria bacterium]|nr:phosphoglycolate phosphatase [Gammaproteobacteria bacterium]
MSREKQIAKGILFDLDGTLLDTAVDLSQALNRILQARGLAPLSLPVIRPSVGRGCKGLLKLGLNMDEDHPEYLGLCDELLGYYEEHMFDTTQLFPGMESILTHLENTGIPWGIVTNKPGRFTAELLKRLKLNDRANCVISGDTLANRKPHPEPVLRACELLNQKPGECLYVGDAEIDIIASKAAGTPVVVAMYGYIASDEDPKTWNADGYIHHPAEIMEWLS